jgi:hypothetical protein
MLHRPSSALRTRKNQAQARWRANAKAGRCLVHVPITASVLDWLRRNYPGETFNPDDPASVGALIGRILESSAHLDR